jgi:hypothetical protein
MRAGFGKFLANLRQVVAASVDVGHLAADFFVCRKSPLAEKADWMREN